MEIQYQSKINTLRNLESRKPPTRMKHDRDDSFEPLFDQGRYLVSKQSRNQIQSILLSKNSKKRGQTLSLTRLNKTRHWFRCFLRCYKDRWKENYHLKKVVKNGKNVLFPYGALCYGSFFVIGLVFFLRADRLASLPPFTVCMIWGF